MSRVRLGLVLVSMLSPFAAALGQKVTLIDAQFQVPVPYATAEWVGSDRGVVADAYGRIDVSDMPSGVRLRIRSIGYKACVRALDSISGDTIQLRSSIKQLDEVVVRPLSPQAYILRAMNKLKDNYSLDSFATENYYQEMLVENEAVINHVEAFIEVHHPGYESERNSFDVRIKAAKKSDVAALSFMTKEQEKERKKELKDARKEGRGMDEDTFEWPLELASPPLLLLIDPLRHSGEKMTVNEDNVQFLDSSNTAFYNYWFGKPVSYGERTLMVIHFDQREDVKRSMLKGTLWIDQETDAFVKISFGLSERGLHHLVPGYLKAALWIYGLDYALKETLFEFEYAPFGDKWRLQTTRLKAKVWLEKRRLFNPNESSDFDYKCEMITTRTSSIQMPFASDRVYDTNELLSDQLKEVSDAEWKALKKESRNYY